LGHLAPVATALTQKAGIAAQLPLSIAVVRGNGAVEEWSQGRWPDGRAVAASDTFYAASLAKQITGVAVATLVAGRRLDPDASLRAHIEGLPEWMDDVSVRDVLHHIGGLPPGGVLEATLGARNWTNDYAINALRIASNPQTKPGTTFTYSNVGYICLGRLVETLTGTPFGRYVEELLTGRGLSGMRFVDNDSVRSFQQSALLEPNLPLSTGDGGLWTTAASYARWLHRANREDAEIAALVEQAGRLTDGTVVDYGWGIGLRTFRGEPLYVHAGSWRGAGAKAVRCPTLGLGAVVLAATSDLDPIASLTSDLVDWLADS
jgi:CubicO group peptidase (beta-lactamase class C family)